MLKLADQPHQSKLELEPREGEPCSLTIQLVIVCQEGLKAPKDFLP